MLTKFLSLMLLFVLPVSVATSTSVYEPKTETVDLYALLSAATNHETDLLPLRSTLAKALYGYELLQNNNIFSKNHLITLIDFSLPSDAKRLWIIDLLHNQILLHCYVSHGRNSGALFAEHFSNTPGSYTSSPGFYVTGETYSGRHGLSLYLDGLEKGINDNARARAIVMHGADYVSESFIQQHGRLGRSHGCPAVPQELNETIINIIKGGSCLYIHTEKDSYLGQSKLIHEMRKVSSESRAV